MVDIDQHGIEAPVGALRVEAGAARRQREEVAGDEAAARIAGERRPHGQEPRPVPADHRFQHLDDDERGDVGMVEDGLGGIAEAKAGDGDIGRAAGQTGEAEIGQRDLRGGEEAGHQELVAELDLVDVDVEPVLAPPSETEGADRRLLIVKFLEKVAQAMHPAAASPVRRPGGP